MNTPTQYDVQPPLFVFPRSEPAKRARRTRGTAALIMAALGLTMFMVPTAGADATGSLSMGPQAMEGNLRLDPGTTLLVGYDMTIPGSHPAANITFVAPQVAFVATCVAGGSAGSFVVQMPTAVYADPASSSSWYPSGDQHSAAVYQGQLAVPDLCDGGQVRLSNGGTFTTTVQSDVAINSVHVRWHYSANGTSGSWSGTSSVTPTIGESCTGCGHE